MPGVILFACGASDVVVQLNHVQSAAATTLRKDATMLTEVRVLRGKNLDVCAELGMSRKDALDLLAASPDVKRLVSANLLKVRDQFSPPPDEPVQAVKSKVKPAITPPAPKLVPVTEPSGPDLPTPMREKSEVDNSDITNGMSLSGVVLPKSQPSAKWTKAELEEYAKRKGVAVTPEMSKNAILRKLRTN